MNGHGDQICNVVLRLKNPDSPVFRSPASSVSCGTVIVLDVTVHLEVPDSPPRACVVGQSSENSVQLLSPTLRGCLLNERISE